MHWQCIMKLSSIGNVTEQLSNFNALQEHMRMNKKAVSVRMTAFLQQILADLNVADSCPLVLLCAQLIVVLKIFSKNLNRVMKDYKLVSRRAFVDIKTQVYNAKCRTLTASSRGRKSRRPDFCSHLLCYEWFYQPKSILCSRCVLYSENTVTTLGPFSIQVTITVT